ncbi:hypothetical protein D3C71_1607680 [compost metagenome]
MLDAPGLFSTTTGCPIDTAIFSPTTRARVSMAPPGGAGTMILTGRLGYAACAAASEGRVRSDADTARIFSRWWVGFMVVSFMVVSFMGGMDG